MNTRTSTVPKDIVAVTVSDMIIGGRPVSSGRRPILMGHSS